MPASKVYPKLLIAIVASLLVANFCSKGADENSLPPQLLENSPKGELKITLHDAPILAKDINSVNMTILETKIVDFEDNIYTVSTEAVSFNLLELTANNPVTLAHARVKPGSYKQIRLILDGNTSLTFGDGTTEPLKVPSSEESGLKIDGIFTVPEGLLYTLDIDIDPNKSIHHTRGEGYIMKPVITLVGDNILHGNFAYKGQLGSHDFIYNLKSDGSFDLISGRFPDYQISGRYYFDGVDKTLDMNLSRIYCAKCSPVIDYNRDALGTQERDIHYSVVTWGADYIELVSEKGAVMTLNAISEFALSAIRETVEVQANVAVNNPEYENYYLVGMLYPDPVSGAGEAPIVAGQIRGGAVALNYHLSKTEVPLNGSRNYHLTLIVVKSSDDIVFNETGITAINNEIELKPGAETQFKVEQLNSPLQLSVEL